jgi:cardiolipin synthase
VIDGKVAYSGGINLADEYANRIVRFGHWKDCAIRLEGEAVAGFTAMFLNLWNIDSPNESDDYQYYIDASEKIQLAHEGGFIIPFGDCPLDNMAVGKRVYLDNLNNAKDYVHIMTPYLVPDTVLLSALENAAKNGIDVRIIMPGIPDKKIVYMLSQSFYPVLLKAGVKIYEYTPGFVHAKVFLSDDELAVVGTINLDYRSLAHHFEDAVWMYKTFAVSEIKKDFMETFAKSKEVPKEGKKESVLRRILMPILRLFAPLF